MGPDSKRIKGTGTKNGASSIDVSEFSFQDHKINKNTTQSIDLKNRNVFMGNRGEGWYKNLTGS